MDNKHNGPLYKNTLIIPSQSGYILHFAAYNALLCFFWNNKRKRTTDQQIQNVESLDGTAECDITPAKRKGRGPGAIVDSTDAIEKRPEIWRVGKHEFSCEEDPRKITAAITRLALNYMPKPLRSYNAFPIKAKNNAEKAFLVPLLIRFFLYYTVLICSQCLGLAELVAVDSSY